MSRETQQAPGVDASAVASTAVSAMGHPTIRPRPGVLDISPYVGGASKAAGANRTTKLSSNENPYGPSPKALEAAKASLDHMESYPDGGALALREAIAAAHGIEVDRIVCGAGSDELIALLCKAYAGEGDEVLASENGFLMYRLSTLAAGGRYVTAPEQGLTTDIDAMIAALTPATRLVFLADPNNPTGTMVGAAEVARLADALPDGALLVIDAAYAEYVREDGEDGGIALVRDSDNVVMTRTFSKIHGLAALRLGWAYGPAHVIDVLNRVRGPFNVTVPAIAAGTAAVADRDWVEHCAVANEAWREWLARALEKAGFTVVPSRANFLLVEAGARVDAFDTALKARGFVVRRMEGYGLPQHLRITVGDEAACRGVAEVAANLGIAGP
ncbi:MAG: histidinol-phosphate transaminase [Pseudomonadota bacterium]